MAGLRTYLALAAGIIIKILESIGIVQFNSKELEDALFIIIMVIAGIFRYLATRNKTEMVKP